MSSAVPASYVGLWRRTLLRTPGVEDTSTRVFWLQTMRWHADIRVAAERPVLRNRDALDRCDRSEWLALSRQQGFAGITEVDGDICRWHRHFDFQPPSGHDDVARMAFDSADRLLEYGVEQDYFEIWERVPVSSAENWMRRLETADGGCELLLSVGQWVIYVRPRRIPLVRVSRLDTLLDAAPTDAECIALLDFEISFGQRSANGRLWQVELSTLPWREGQDLALADRLDVTS